MDPHEISIQLVVQGPSRHDRAVTTPARFEDRSLAHPRDDETRFLMSRPQPFVILPTMWFWSQLRRTEPRLHVFTTLLWALLFIPLSLVAFTMIQPLWAQAIAVSATVFLSAGIVEKALRVQILRRRRALGCGDSGER